MRAAVILVLGLGLGCAHAQVIDRGAGVADGCRDQETCWNGGDGSADDIASIAIAATLLGVISVATVQRLLAR